MAYVITSRCIGVQDRACVDVCPVRCIDLEVGVDSMLFIDPERCIDCGACELACPVSAIFFSDDAPGDEEPFIEINALWFADRAAARNRQAEIVNSPVQGRP